MRARKRVTVTQETARGIPGADQVSRGMPEDPHQAGKPFSFVAVRHQAVSSLHHLCGEWLSKLGQPVDAQEGGMEARERKRERERERERVCACVCQREG